jgi:hypothetical protein
MLDASIKKEERLSPLPPKGGLQEAFSFIS